MTSSPAPDLEAIGGRHNPLKLEFKNEPVTTVCRMDRQSWPCDATEAVRAARAAVAESGRLREALREWIDAKPRYRLDFTPAERAAWQREFNDEWLQRGPEVVHRALEATPPAPSDHGALDVAAER